MSALFGINDVARTFVRFYRKPDSGNHRILTDPTAVTCVVKTPGNVETVFTYGADPELERISTGFYKLERACDEVGTWRARWKATGAVVAVDEVSWTVESTTFSNT